MYLFIISSVSFLSSLGTICSGHLLFIVNSKIDYRLLYNACTIPFVVPMLVSENNVFINSLFINIANVDD
jgi:hypothetical protein